MSSSHRGTCPKCNSHDLVFESGFAKCLWLKCLFSESCIDEADFVYKFCDEYEIKKMEEWYQPQWELRAKIFKHKYKQVVAEIIEETIFDGELLLKLATIKAKIDRISTFLPENVEIAQKELREISIELGGD